MENTKFKSSYDSSRETLSDEAEKIPEEEFDFWKFPIRIPYDVVNKLLNARDTHDEEVGGFIQGDRIKFSGDKVVLNWDELVFIENTSDNPAEKYEHNIKREVELLRNNELSVDRSMFHTHPKGINPSESDLGSVTSREVWVRLLVAPEDNIYFYSKDYLPFIYLVWDNWFFPLRERNKVSDVAADAYPEQVHDVVVANARIDGR